MRSITYSTALKLLCITAMLVQGKKAKKVLWEFDSISIVQNMSHNLLLF